LIEPARVYADRIGDRHLVGSVIQAALQIHQKNIFARIQFVP
jgi:hypothetical protein